MGNVGHQVFAFLSSLCLIAHLQGCYAGSIGAVVGLSASDGSTGGLRNSPVEVRELSIDPIDAKTSPVEISFKIYDEESDSANIEIFYFRPNSEAAIQTNVIGQLENLSTSPDGVTYRRDWDFASQED